MHDNNIAYECTLDCLANLEGGSPSVPPPYATLLDYVCLSQTGYIIALTVIPCLVCCSVSVELVRACLRTAGNLRHGSTTHGQAK